MIHNEKMNVTPSDSTPRSGQYYTCFDTNSYRVWVWGAARSALSQTRQSPIISLVKLDLKRSALNSIAFDSSWTFSALLQQSRPRTALLLTRK